MAFKRCGFFLDFGKRKVFNWRFCWVLVKKQNSNKIDLFVYKCNLETGSLRYCAHLGEPYSHFHIKNSKLKLIGIYLKVKNSKLNSFLEEIYNFKGSDEKLNSKLTKIVFLE